MPDLPYSPVIPALRWSPHRGYDLDTPEVAAALAAGVPGFILFGGTADGAQEAARHLEARAGRRLLLGADLERGAGQQFRGATPLPPLAALGSLDDLEVTRAAGALTAREAVGLGVPWVFAPVADLALERENPIVGSRAFHGDPARVARHVVAWIQGCASEGGIACVKHFPGHGRTVTDSHAVLPVVEADAALLEATDLLPFRAAVEAGVPSVMTAHVAYPSLDPSGLPATRSRRLVDGLLRGSLGFRGVTVTDALIMEGAGRVEDAAVEALGAGVDLLLYPPPELDPGRTLALAAGSGGLPPVVLDRGRRRVLNLMGSVPAGAGAGRWGREEDRARALEWAVQSLRLRDPGQAWQERGRPAGVILTVVDDDLGGPWDPPARDQFPSVLREGGVRVSREAETDPSSASPGALHLLAVFAEPRAWKSRAGLSSQARARMERWAGAVEEGQGLLVCFGGTRILEELPASVPALLAWGGEELMQEAAARWILAGGGEGHRGGGRG